ncbi:MAG TPA: DUF3108 domain-containing protein [Telluria sp.]|nr:DUF3108 domain-containing protein [Telluria sp.]
MLKHLAGGALLALLMAVAGAAEHVAVKRPVDIPPSADLSYSIKARQKGFSISGDAVLSWRTGAGKYSLRADTRAMFVGNILENRSDGLIDGFGIAPNQFYEKRIRRDPYTTTFDRSAKTISFTESKEVYPLKGGEQDRSSVSWQLAAVARAAPEKFTPGSEWVFFVAGRRDADPWTFKVVGHDSVRTGFGAVDAVHLVRLPPPDSKDQKLDIWLAPAHEWYPVRVRFTDSDDEFVDQTLEKIVKK